MSHSRRRPVAAGPVGGPAERPADDAPLVVVVGDVIDDVVVRPLAPIVHGSDTPASVVVSPGGSGANQAAWLSSCGARVRFVGRVAAGDVERHAGALTEVGVEPLLAGDPERETGRIVVLVDEDGERSMLTDRGANLALSPSDIPEGLLDDADALHCSGYSLLDPDVRATVLPLLDRARAAGIAVSVDPSSVGFLRAVGASTFRSWIDGTDVLLPNLDEGRLLSARDAPGQVLEELLTVVRVVAMTLGGDGAIVAERGAEPVVVGAEPADVLDTTGAGDAFCGGFLASWLRGAGLADAARAGVAAAAAAVRVPGGRPRPGAGDVTAVRS